MVCVGRRSVYISKEWLIHTKNEVTFSLSESQLAPCSACRWIQSPYQSYKFAFVHSVQSCFVYSMYSNCS